MSRPLLALLAAAVILAAGLGAVAGYYAGNRAATRAVAAAELAATRAAGRAQSALRSAEIADAQAQAAKDAATAGLGGVCWAERRGVVTTIAAPLARPGGETCPRRAPRFTPADPEPAGAETGSPGG